MSNSCPLKVFVGSIPVGVSDEDVQSYFRLFAPDARFCFERKPYKNVSSGGYGFLLLSTRRELDAIVSQSHYIGERLLKCGEYFSGDTLNEYRIQLSKRRILIRNVKKTISDKDIEEFFGTFGELDSAYIVKFQSSNRQRSFGYVTFKREEPAKHLLELGKVVINDIEIFILPFLKSTFTKPAPAQVQKNQQLAYGTAKKRSDYMSYTTGVGSAKVSKELDYYHESWMVGEDAADYFNHFDYFNYEAQASRTSSSFNALYGEWENHRSSEGGSYFPEVSLQLNGLKNYLSKDAEPFMGCSTFHMSPEQEQLADTYDYSHEEIKPTSRKYAKFAEVTMNHTAENLAFHFCDLEAEETAEEQEVRRETTLTKCDQASLVNSHKNS